jgi:hypothetical protein
MHKHGVSRSRFMEVVASVPCAIIVMKDMTRAIFGGFASEPFHENPSRGYYGSGECVIAPRTCCSLVLLVLTCQTPSTHPLMHLMCLMSMCAYLCVPIIRCFVFKIQTPASATAASSSASASAAGGARAEGDGSSTVQLFRWRGDDDYFMISDGSYIAMGGGAAYAWHIDANFRFGTSGPCSTFESPMLSNAKEFQLNEMEVWAPIAAAADVEVIAADMLLHPAHDVQSSTGPPTTAAANKPADAKAAKSASGAAAAAAADDEDSLLMQMWRLPRGWNPGTLSSS